MAIKSGIYAIIHSGSGKFYIGSSLDMRGRWSQHKHKLVRNQHHSRHLQSAWNKYGPSAFEFHELLECACELLEPYEQRAIDELQPTYNMSPTAGTSRGVKHTKETRANMSAAQKGKIMPLEVCAKISRTLTGRTRPPEVCAKISIGMMGHTGGLGIPCSAEKRAKISAAQKGKPRPELIGRPCSDETRRKIGAAVSARAAEKQNLKRQQVTITQEV